MSILFSKTEKSKPVLIENGFDYIEEHTHENKVYWRCTQCNKQECKASLYTISNTICHMQVKLAPYSSKTCPYSSSSVFQSFQSTFQVQFDELYGMV